MWAAQLSTLDFRNLDDAAVELDRSLTVLHGHNGAGKTNLLEALFFALTGRSCRTRRERELIRFGAPLARAEVELEPGAPESVDGDGELHATPSPGAGGPAGKRITMLASVSSAEGRRRLVDARPARPADDLARMAISVFMPDRLALVKGPPSPRRAHLDRLAGALWPARGALRTEYSRTLAQRNALLSRVRRGGDRSALEAWDLELARRAVPLTEAREAAANELIGPFTETAEALGLDGDARIAYRPKIESMGEAEVAAELASRRDSDLRNGHSTWGPHRDEVELSINARSLRRYGSQGQQRLGLLALLFAEREALRQARRRLPLMLLDDVMSELDPGRRRRLVELLDRGGQALITTTEAAHVPAGDGAHTELAISAGRLETTP